MKLVVVKEIVSKYSLSDLTSAEEDLMEERPLEIEVEGDDEGEQLTHIIAAKWIIEEMDKEKIPLAKAVRNYTQRVRNSIS